MPHPPQTEATADHLRVTKRRVPVRVRLNDGSHRDGLLYSDVHRDDGTPATILDRLNDPREVYLPLAADDHHQVLLKSSIVTVHLDATCVPVPDVAGTRVLPVRVALRDGTTVEGEIRAVAPPTHARVLDYLNHAATPFLALVRHDEAILVNHASIVHVIEAAAAD